MKVMVVSHTYITSINRDKWRILAKQHPDVQLALVFPQQWPTTLFYHKAYIAADEATFNYKPYALATHNEGNELLYSYAEQSLFSLIKAVRPDIMHVEQGSSALSYAQINFYCKILKLQTKSLFFTWINWQPRYTFKTNLFVKICEKFNFTCATGAIVGNNDAQKLLIKKGFKKPIMILPQLGVNQHIFKQNQLIKKFINTSKKYICFIGRITPEKGVFLLANAFIKLAKQFPDWSLIFIGNGNAFHALHNFVTQKNMLHCIEFCNAVSHESIPIMLQKIDLLVLPSYDTQAWREQFGHVLIEAMSCKIPVLGSNAGEIPHVIANAGYIFEQNNEQSLLAQLQTLIQDETLRKKLGDLGYERVQQHYTHEIIADKTYHFWQQCINQ